MRPMVAAVAADEPETAAKSPQPTTFKCNRRPGSEFIHGDRPENISSDSRERNKISPIQMNKGNAASAHELLEPQAVIARIDPTGDSVKISIPIMPTPSRESPTQSPLPRNTNNTNNKNRVRYICSMVAILPHQCQKYRFRKKFWYLLHCSKMRASHGV